MTKKLKRYLLNLCRLAAMFIGGMAVFDLIGPAVLAEHFNLAWWSISLFGTAVIAAFVWWGFVRMRDGDFLTED